MSDGWSLPYWQPRFGIVLGTTAVGVFMAAHWAPMMVPTVGVLVMALVRPRMATRPVVWWIFGAAWLLVVIVRQETMEDHVYLFTAWLVALAIALARRDDDFLAVAALQARVLIGVTFAVAAGWKLYFAEYVSGVALWVFMLIDARFGPLVGLVGLRDSVIEQGQTGIDGLLAGTWDSVLLTADGPVVARVVGIAILALVLELIIAVSHLAPDSSSLAKVRLPALVVFAVTTYAVVPVFPFAGLLAVLGATSARWRAEILWTVPVIFLVSLARYIVLVT